MQKTYTNQQKIIQKSSPDPPKIEAKKLVNGLQKQVRIQSRSRGAPSQIFGIIFSDFEASWLPRWLHVGGQDGAKIDKKSMQKKDEILKASWNLQKSENLRFWRATWKQVGTKIDAEIDVIFERRFFEKTLSFLKEKYTFLRSRGSKLGAKIDQKSM